MKQWITDDEILNRAAHHPPSSKEIIAAHETIRREFAELAINMNHLLPEGPLKTVTINNILRVMQDANTCIAVEQRVYVESQEQPDMLCAQCNEGVFYGYPKLGAKMTLLHHSPVRDEDHKAVLAETTKEV